jgi:hexosaminidase
MRPPALIVLLLMFLVPASRGQSPRPALLPQPASLQPGSGSLPVEASFTVALTGHREPRLDRAAERFLARLGSQTGLPVGRSAGDAAKATLLIHTERAGKEVQELGEDESYTLEVSPAGARLNAANPLGALRGMATFLQLVEIGPGGFAAPAVSISDRPRFAWRGLMIDVARHFIPVEVLERNLDGMEAVKMNVLHLHLSENQGFRVESRKFPKLHEQGSDGLYYTQEQVRALVGYARDRGIRVVPEFDMPGHSTAWFVGHPEIASGPGPYSIDRKWGVLDPAMDPTLEKTYKFLDDFVAEMSRLFPDRYFHIGGDEVNGKEWDANPKIQEFKKAHNLKSNEELQAYFSERVQKIVTRHGKSVVGWDEVFVPGVPKDIVIQSWRGQESLAAAAKQGYQGILSNGYYLDLGWSAARHYAVDPLSGPAAELTEAQKKLVLGGESCMWSEYVDAGNVDSRIWPRNAAIAERLWSPQSVTDPASLYERLDAVAARLERLGLTHRSYYRGMLERIAGPATAEEFAALITLARVVEPVKEYTREETAPAEATSRTPLNRVVDAVSLESDVARRFSERVDRFVGGSCKDAALAADLRRELTRWSRNEAEFASLARKSALAKEAEPSSHDLSQTGAAGLAALEALPGGSRLDRDAASRATAALAEAAKPKLQLLLVPVNAVKKLVEAASEGGACAVR